MLVGENGSLLEVSWAASKLALSHYSVQTSVFFCDDFKELPCPWTEIGKSGPRKEPIRIAEFVTFALLKKNQFAYFPKFLSRGIHNSPRLRLNITMLHIRNVTSGYRELN